MADNNWYYEKMNDDYELERCPQDDKDGSVTGKIVLNVPAWFDENPDERIRLGWTKHITHTAKEQHPDYNPLTQFAVQSYSVIDDYTIEDVYYIRDKSEEQLAFEQLLSVSSWGNSWLTVN